MTVFAYYKLPSECLALPQRILSTHYVNKITPKAYNDGVEGEKLRIGKIHITLERERYREQQEMQESEENLTMWKFITGNFLSC